MERLRIAGMIAALTSSSCVGAGLMGAGSAANTVADETADGPASDSTIDATEPTSNDATQGPSTVDDSGGCIAAAWDDQQWDGACWQ